MDLGIKGRKAIVCAASKGLGKGCAAALAREGVEVTICARGEDALNSTVQELRKLSGAKVTAVVCDVTTEEGRKRLLSACANPDILINNAGGPATSRILASMIGARRSKATCWRPSRSFKPPSTA